MMKQIIISINMISLLLIMVFSQNLYAQARVGIGTNDPTELLDVNGNLNLRGQLKLDGNEGESGNVLSIDANGNPSWAAANEFTSFMQAYESNATLTIPATVKKVMIEVWGAGGGGAQGGGGASGNYAMGVFNINAATTLTIVAGSPGGGATTYAGAASDGGFSEVTGTGIFIRATGGRGANAFFGGLLPNNGIVGGSISGTALRRGIKINGENGKNTTQTTYQVAATTWHTSVYFGSGGNPPMGIGKGGHGSFRIHNQASAPDGTSIKLYQGGYAGIAAGGGGGQRLGAGWGWDGGKGYVVIRY